MAPRPDSKVRSGSTKGGDSRDTALAAQWILPLSLSIVILRLWLLCPSGYLSRSVVGWQQL